MRKSTLFISVALTTFMLAIMVGVVSAYQAVMNHTLADSNPPQAQAVVVQEATSAPEVASIPPTAAPQQITPQEAADLAVKVLGRTDLFSAELSNFNGTPAYLITFNNGDVVYVGLDGQILSITQAPTFVVTSNGGGNGGGGNVQRSRDDSHSDGGDVENEHEAGDN